MFQKSDLANDGASVVWKFHKVFFESFVWLYVIGIMNVKLQNLMFETFDLSNGGASVESKFHKFFFERIDWLYVIAIMNVKS